MNDQKEVFKNFVRPLLAIKLFNFLSLPPFSICILMNGQLGTINVCSKAF